MLFAFETNALLIATHHYDQVMPFLIKYMYIRSHRISFVLHVHNVYRLVSSGEANQIRLARLGILLSLCLYSQNPWKYKLWQSITAVELWEEGATEKTVSSLNRLGLSQSKATARHHIDKLIEHSDEDVKKWKHSIEVGILIRIS